MTLEIFLDDIDREAMREGAAIKRSDSHKRRDRKCACTKKGKKEPELDILRMLNIVQSNKHDTKQPQYGNKGAISKT